MQRGQVHSVHGQLIRERDFVAETIYQLQRRLGLHLDAEGRAREHDLLRRADANITLVERDLAADVDGVRAEGDSGMQAVAEADGAGRCALYAADEGAAAGLVKRGGDLRVVGVGRGREEREEEERAAEHLRWG